MMHRDLSLPGSCFLCSRKDSAALPRAPWPHHTSATGSAARHGRCDEGACAETFTLGPPADRASAPTLVIACTRRKTP
jgi:hypothetical protein